jgi:hypothetical protein
MRLTRYASAPDSLALGVGDARPDSPAKATAILSLEQAERLAHALLAEVDAARAGAATWEQAA